MIYQNQDPRCLACECFELKISHYVKQNDVTFRCGFIMRKPGQYEEAQIMAALVRHRFFLKGDSRGIPADLSFKNLSGLDLSKQILTNIVFKGSCLSGSRLSECDLTGADFFGADLEGADLHGSTLTGADFRGANLSRAILSHCQLHGSDFSASGASGGDNAKLTDAKLDHAMLCQANLNGCDMSGAELIDADLSGADLSKASLIGAELSGATLDNVKLSNTVIELTRLTDTQLGQVGSTDGVIGRTYDYVPPAMIQASIREHLVWIESGGGKGKRIDFDGADLSLYSFACSNLSGARFRRCSFKGGNLSSVIIDMADMTHCDLSHSNLKNSSIRGTTLRGVDLSHSNMAGARITTMPFKGVKSWPANLDRALLHSADLTNTVFEKAVMSYADLTNCIIAGTNFIDTDLTTVKKSNRNFSIESSECRRTSRRFTEPKLFVKTKLGVFGTINWSMTGICLSYNGDVRYSVDDQVSVKIVAEGHPPPQEATLTVIKDDVSRGVVLLKFNNISESLALYLHALTG